MLAEYIGVPQLRDLAGRSEQIADKINVRDMSRIAELLHSAYDGSSGKLEVEITFLGGLQGYPEISFRVNGQLGISCQRCLGLLHLPVDMDFRLVIVGSEADLEHVAEPYDAIVASEHGVQVIGLIEDELLASLPFAPMHVDTSDCEAEINPLSTESESGVEPDENRPFSDLATLMAKSRKPNDNTN